MRARFVVRLLDASDNLLAWTEVEAEARPQDRAGSCPFFAVAPTLFEVEQSGRVARVAVHWPDLDVARVTTPVAELDVRAGDVVNYAWIEPVWLVPGMRDVALPAVTVRKSVAIGVPSGGLRAGGGQ